MVYSEKENLYTDLENFVFIAQTGISGIQLGLFMALQKKKKGFYSTNKDYRKISRKCNFAVKYG